jgi:hypothetical protein
LVDLSSDDKPHIVVGLSGSGKTRAMYELLSQRFGFYWTCSVQRNGGAIEVSKVVENLDNSDPAFVQFAVNRLAAIYGVLFLVWRRIHGDLGPLDWLVFQTTNAALSNQLAANERGAIDDAVDAVISQLKPYSLEKSVVAVLNRVRAAVEKNIVVVVDEAQALVVIGKDMPGSALSSWVQQLRALHTVWWLAGTSLSLRNAEMIARSAALKLKAVGHTGIQSGGRTVRVMPLVFAEVETFKAHLHDVVGEALDSLVESELMWDLFDMFRGRARPVTLLAHGIRRLSVNHTLKPDAIRHIALLLRDGALNPGLPTSYIADLLRKLELAAYKEHAAALGKVVTAIMTGASDAVSGALKVHVELFESAIGQLVLTPVEESTDAILKQVVLIEPLAQEAVVMAFMIRDPMGLYSLNPVQSALQEMSTLSAYSSAIGFMAEVLAAPFVHYAVADAIATAEGGARSVTLTTEEPDETRVKFSTCRCDDIALALGYDAARAAAADGSGAGACVCAKNAGSSGLDPHHQRQVWSAREGQVHARVHSGAVGTCSAHDVARVPVSQARRCEPTDPGWVRERVCCRSGGDGGTVDERLCVLCFHAGRAAERGYRSSNGRRPRVVRLLAEIDAESLRAHEGGCLAPHARDQAAGPPDRDGCQGHCSRFPCGDAIFGISCQSCHHVSRRVVGGRRR